MRNNRSLMSLAFASLVALLTFFLLYYIPGLNVFIFYGVLSFCLLAYLYFQGDLKRRSSFLPVTIGIVLLSLIPLYRTNLFYVFLVFFSLPIAFYLLYTVPKKQLKNFGVVQFVTLPLTMIIVWLTDTIEAIKRFNLRDAKGGLSKSSKQYLIGLAASLPFLLIFLILFSSADAVFFTYLKDYVDVTTFAEFLRELFEDETMFTLLYRVVMSLVMSVYFFAVYHAIFLGKSGWEDVNRRIENLIGKVKATWSPKTLGTFLLPLNILFALFVLVQIRYFFGGEESIVGLGETLGYTFSEYARRGFVELVIVSFAVFLIIGFLQSKVILKESVKPLWYKSNAIVLLLLTMVIGISALSRLNLLTDYYGLTNLRLFGWVVTLAIIILIPIVIYSLYKEKRVFWFNRTYAYAALFSMLLLAVIPTDLVVSRYNIDRYQRTGELDVAYLLKLSPEAQTFTAQFLLSDEVPAETNTFVSYYYDEMYELYKERDYSWQSFNLSRWRFENYLHEQFGDEENYQEQVEGLVEQFIDDYSASLNEGDYGKTYSEYWSVSSTIDEDFIMENIEISELSYKPFFPYEEWLEEVLMISSTTPNLSIILVPADLEFNFDGTKYICEDREFVLGLENGRFVIYESDSFELGIPYYREDYVYEPTLIQLPYGEQLEEAIPGESWSVGCREVE